MGRPKKFDEATVLKKGANVFWLKGYDATSMEDIVRETGLKPGSFYGAFGNKEQFFLKTLHAYQQDLLQALDKVLSVDEPAKQIIENFYDFFIDFCIETPQGCFLVNTLFETHHQNESQMNLIRELFEQIELRMIQILQRAQQESVILSNHNPELLAKIMITHIYGLRGYSKLTTDKSTLTEIKNQLVAMLFCKNQG